MIVKVLVKKTIASNILSIIKNNSNLKNNQITFYDDSNWHNVFKKTNKFDRLIVVDDYGYGPSLFYSKQNGLLGTLAFNQQGASLIRAHNDSKVCIIPIKTIDSIKELNPIINTFLKTDFEGGRHATRLKILHSSFTTPAKPVSFSKVPNKTVVIACDHAAYELKETISRYLIGKNYIVINVGTNSTDSTHYSMYGIALAKHVPQATHAIACCWTGMGISNTVNKFKGLRACVCRSPKDVEVACNTYGCNVLSLGSKFVKADEALKIVDKYLATKPNTKNKYKILDRYGFQFDKVKFSKIKIDKNIAIPNELK